MKNIIKNIIIFNFKILTSLYIWKNRIEVIAITGSAGKTTTKMALTQFLEDDNTYIPTKDYNTEIGLPLAVFEEDVPTNLFKIGLWLKIILTMILKLLKKSPYKRIVLEMGADHSGDIARLTSLAKPRIAIITAVLPVHTENFKNIGAIAKEKSQILKHLTEKDLAVLNYDDPNIRNMKTRAQVIWVGEDKKADLRMENINFSLEGLSFDLSWKSNKQPVNMKIIAPQLLTSLLSAFAVGLYLGESFNVLCDKMENFEQQNGRMKLLAGIRDSHIIDDSYNANPSSTVAALNVLANLKGRKIAVLGNMNELGDLEIIGHQNVGIVAAKCSDILITVGDRAKKYIAPEFNKVKGRNNLKSFVTPYEAGDYLRKIIKKDDIILVKGSQNKTFTEETVKIIMAEPKKAGVLLVRQSSFWLKKKEECFKS